MEKEPVYEQSGVAMTCRSFTEYVRMFALEEKQLAGLKVLDVAGGASSFTTEANQRGVEAVAADPLYSMPPEEIEEFGRKEIEASTAKLSALTGKYDWTYYGNLTKHKAIREQSLKQFVADYRREQATGRYTAGKLPELGLPEGQFDLVLCSHFLFLYAAQFDYEFHLAGVRELLRLCRPGGEVRIYPLQDFTYTRYPLLALLLHSLEMEEIEAEFLPTGLPFFPGSTEVLRLVKHLRKSI